MLKKMLPGWVCLLMLTATSAHVTRAAGPAPTAGPHPPAENRPVLEIAATIHPDGTWAGEALLAGTSPPGASSGLGEALPAQVDREARVIFGDRVPDQGQDPTYALSMKGDDASEITELALRAGQVAERLAGPVALELQGTVRAGQAVTIALPGNPSTGYWWEAEALDRATMSQAGDVEIYQSSLGLGVPAQYVVHMKAAQAGQANLRLVYRRPWQPDIPPQVAVSIQAAAVDLAQACAMLSVPLPPPVQTLPEENWDGEALHSGPTPGQADPSTSASSVPAAYDWCEAHGGCPPVRDQGQCGSCWAFGTVGPLEAWAKVTGSSGGADLAEQYLLSCNTSGWGCGGGWWAHDYHWYRTPPGEPGPGAVLESAFPYQAADIPCAGPYDHPHKVVSWDYVGAGDGVPPAADIKQAIYAHGPVAVALCVGSQFDQYTGGVFEKDETCSRIINHAAVLVGWDDSDQAWILRNSWGTDWGEDGYMRIRYGFSMVGFAANYIVYEHSNISDWIYLPMVMRNTPTPSLAYAWTRR